MKSITSARITAGSSFFIPAAPPAAS